MRSRLASTGTENKALDRVREEADRRRLLEQLDQADKILSDKINVIQQLEEKLVAQSNQRERFSKYFSCALKKITFFVNDFGQG